MHKVRVFLMSSLVALLLVGTAVAGEVHVFMPVDEELSPMALRSKAMAEGFAMAVVEEARPMLPGKLDEARSDLFKEYLLTNAKPFIQGYKILNSEDMSMGLSLVLDVRVNKKTLRDALKRLGLMTTIVSPLEVSVVWPSDFTEEELVKLQGLMTFTGIQNAPDVMPSFLFERGPEGTHKARLEFDDHEWVAINKDMTKAWVELWSRYFTRSEVTQLRTGIQKLTVSGWFSPDAALEFDRVLKSWDSSVQEVELLELDMQPTGVGGTWEIRLLSGARLDMMLNSYLPQRGLSYQLSEESTP